MPVEHVIHNILSRPTIACVLVNINQAYVLSIIGW